MKAFTAALFVLIVLWYGGLHLADTAGAAYYGESAVLYAVDNSAIIVYYDPATTTLMQVTINRNDIPVEDCILPVLYDRNNHTMTLFGVTYTTTYNYTTVVNQFIMRNAQYQAGFVTGSGIRVGAVSDGMLSTGDVVTTYNQYAVWYSGQYERMMVAQYTPATPVYTVALPLVTAP